MQFKKFALHYSAGLACLSSSLLACGGPGDSSDAGENHYPKAWDGQPAPPNTTYSPSPEGRAVGIRAIVEVDGVTLTSEPLEINLFAEEGAAVQPPDFEELSVRPPEPGPLVNLKSRPLNAGPHPLNSQAQLDQNCHIEGELVSEIYTEANAVSYVSSSYSAGFIVAEQFLSLNFYLGRDGIYAASSTGTSAYFPPDLVHGSMLNGVGVLSGNGSGEITREYLEGLSGISISYSLAWHSVGYTVFTQAEGGLARGIQYDTGSSISFLGFPTSIGASYEISSTPHNSLRFIKAWDGACDGSGGSKPHVVAMRDNLRALVDQGPPTTLEDALIQQLAAGALPLYENLSESGNGGPGNNVPAASNADMFAEFLSPSAENERVNTSIDGQLMDFVDQVLATEDTGASVLSAFAANKIHVDRSVPSMPAMAALHRGTTVSVAAGAEILGLQSDVPENERFIAPHIQTIEVESGEAADIVISAEEIAALVGASAEDVLLATVYVKAGLTGERVPFELDEATLPIRLEPAGDSVLVRIEVDLSTATGNFPEGVENWIVRPEMRLVKVKSGAPTMAVLSAARKLPSGAPASFSVQVFDANGRIVDSDYQVSLVDAEGIEIATGSPRYGTALLQTVPTPSTPTIHEVENAELLTGDETISGMRIRGSGFSGASRVLVNGMGIAPESMTVESHELILLIPPAGTEGAVTLTVENPGGQTSGVVSAIFTP